MAEPNGYLLRTWEEQVDLDNKAIEEQIEFLKSAFIKAIVEAVNG
jgi:hypothetical protein